MNAPVSEAAFKTKLCKELRRRGCYVVRTVMGGMGRKGVPDLLVCYRGTFIGIEVKRERGMKPTPLQERNLQEISEAGGLAIVMCPEQMDQLARILDRFDEV